MSNQQPASNYRSLTGFVTKLVGDGATYGFINDEIFFPQTNVSGGPAAVGDQVFADCEFSAHLPIKWNATSVKILNKAGGQQHQGSDRQQQEMQFNQADSVAVTYQQHRQQRQQRQMDTKQTDTNMKQQNTEQPTRLLDQANTGEFFVNPYPQQQQQQQQQQQDSNIQPFHDQPMGPPNFTYTSQLGSAFVQNQFVPTPFMTQPPPMLPQQHLLPNNQMHNQNNQRQHNHHNKNMGGRFNNQNDKNDRQNNRRNMNRNDDKYDRSRSGDRDGSQNNRSSKSNDNRDRSSGRNNKRDELPVRPSPPPHSSGRSTTSVSSDRGGKSRRHYEVQNIPKIQIMTNMNAYNMKQRCPNSVHVPSDLKDIIVNRYFRLDIKNTPKPLRFRIEQPRKETASTSADVVNPSVEVDENCEKKSTDSTTLENPSADEISDAPESSNVTTTLINKDQSEQKSQDQFSTPSHKADVKLNHKYGVKVLLISLPEIEAIYKSVFGSNLDSFSTDSKSHSKLDETISLLCNKGSNSGHSLIGGKFDPTLDGFVEDEVNEFERHGRQPDLIAACRRVVLEQAALDLSECRSWTLLATFMYNNKSDYFSSKASIEYSFIYIPHTWTLLSDNFDRSIAITKPLENIVPAEVQEVESSDPVKDNDHQESAEVRQPDSNTEDQPEQADPTSTLTVNNDVSSSVSADNLVDLKVNDLKAELDRRDVKYKAGAKKAELVSLLQECLRTKSVPNSDESHEVKNDEDQEGLSSVSVPVAMEEESQPEEGEVTEAEPSEDSQIAESDVMTPEPNSSNKRKDLEVLETGASSNKKACTESVKEEKVELIKESFIVRARDEQQQLSLVSLNEAAQVSRYDQFELSVASIILKESLVQHLSEYIFTTLIEDNRSKTNSTSSRGTSSNSSSQETSSDTNNNSTKPAFKNPSSSDFKTNLKEFPVDRYINLAFSYFDSSHMGYVYFEDLNKLFNNTGFTISKRALLSLVGDNEKFNYKLLPDLTNKLPPIKVFEYPKQFTRLPQDVSSSSVSQLNTSKTMIEYKGVSYDIERLIQQVTDAETFRVNLVDRFNYAIENSDKQTEEIHVLQVSQNSLAKAIKTQNDEICDLKRERDSIKKKFESLRKGVKGTVSSLSDLVKDDK